MSRIASPEVTMPLIQFRLRPFLLLLAFGSPACADRPAGSLADGGSDGGSTSDRPDSSSDGSSKGNDTDADDTSTGPAAGRCGDGIVDENEACDDGNESDGDGCNVDCRPSGELLWTWEADDDVVSAAVAADDTIYVALGNDDATVVTFLHLSADGVLLDDAFMEIGARTEQPGDVVELHFQSLAVIESTPVYSFYHVLRTADGQYPVPGTAVIVRAGQQGWRVEGGSLAQRIAATPDGSIVGADLNSIFRYTGEGTEAWRVELEGDRGSLRAVAAMADGGLAHAATNMLEVFDAQGAPSWRHEFPQAYLLDGLVTTSANASGGLVAIEEVFVDPGELESIGRVWQFSAGGRVQAMHELEYAPWPIVADMAGNTFVPAPGEGEPAHYALAKYGPDWERLWLTPFAGFPGNALSLDVDGQGAAVLALRNRSVIKIAP
jgi:cysteine-rich repeat protein